MGWAELGATDWVTNSNAKNAVDIGVFSLKPGQSVPSNDNFLTKGEAAAKLNINSISGESNEWPTKNQLIASVNYTAVSGCYYYYQDISSSEYVCSIYGDETYYNATEGSGWNMGDVIYGKYGSVYEPLTGWDTESYLSYTEGGVRKWLKISFAGGVVIEMGTCNTYYAISGCYLDVTGADGASVCAAGWGNETLYSTASDEGWQIGDYVYRDLGQTGVGPYEIVTSTTGYEVYISYSRLGVRSYVGLDVDTNTVYTIGTCAVLQETIIYTMNPRISGFNVILDLSATRNLTSDVTIYVNVHGQWGGATAPASLAFNKNNGLNQYNNYLFNIEEYEGFFEDEPIKVSVVDWDPRYDSYSRYDVG